MKVFGYFILLLGIVFLILFIVGFFQEKNKIYSPIPEKEGIKVIQITPTK